MRKYLDKSFLETNMELSRKFFQRNLNLNPLKSKNLLIDDGRASELKETYCFLKVVNKRYYSTNLAEKKSQKPLNITDIPTPKGIPILGTAFAQLLAGSSAQTHWYIDRRHKELGPIFRERIGTADCLFVSDPAGIRSVFAQEGKYPMHFKPPAWITYNNIHGVSRGLFFMDGEEWSHFRRIMNGCLLRADSNWLAEGCRPAVDNLLEKVGRSAENNEIFDNLEATLYRWSLDAIVSVLMGPEQFREKQHILDDQIQELAASVYLIFETTAKLFLISSEFAAALKIPRWRAFEATVTKALKSTKDLLKVISEQKYHSSEGLMSKLRAHMSEEDVFKMVADLIMAAGDTTAYSMEWVMYLMGKNKHVQDRLRSELKELTQEGENLLSNSLLKNTVKETLRLYPVAPFLTRILPQASNIMGYECPPNTYVIASIFTTGRDERYFENPLEFLPDRWNKREGRNSIVQNTNLPFAIGSRSCIGKKLAEVQMHLTLAELVKKFQFTIENKKEVEVIMKMVAVPSTPIQIKFY